MNSATRPRPSANSAQAHVSSVQYGARIYSAIQPPKSMRGQSAVETMVTVGIAIAFILPMIILFLSTTGLRTQTLAQVQAQGLAQQMADASGEVWYAGNGSHKEILVDYPQGLRSINLSGDLLQYQGTATPCPPAYVGGWNTLQTQDKTNFKQDQSDQLHVAGREIILRIDGGLAGPIDIVSRAPGMVCNPITDQRDSLNYVPGHYGGALGAGLVMLEFTNEGDYVNITRAHS